MTKKLGGWLYGTLFSPGWPRWVLLVAAAAVFVCAALFLAGGTDYREDPSALVPRSVQAYVETNDLDALLRNAGTWSVWQAERRSSPGDQYNRLQVEIAERIGSRVTGLGTRPLRWLAGAGRAAYCVNREEGGGESWAFVVRVPEFGDALSEIAVEQNMRLETIEGTRASGISKLTRGENAPAGEQLFFCTIAPWLIISSAETLPRFALESVARPAFSLAGSEILPGWRGGASLRGVFTPARHGRAGAPGGQPGAAGLVSVYGIVAGWTAPETRINFVASFRNGMDVTFDTATLTDRVRGGGLRPLFRTAVLLLAVLALFLVLAILLIMTGWGGWLKIRAMRLGIAPASAPQEILHSEAFREDAGLQKTGEKEAAASEHSVESIDGIPPDSPEDLPGKPFEAISVKKDSDNNSQNPTAVVSETTENTPQEVDPEAMK